ncbi:hypothetical protein IQ268_08970 [Oculatella sp. LEGE 06141]|uniref:hypothetical protein n=1 Tax=Oculatella sp. LEGE 06141 TaxID=1828648 RepID=UPI0018830CFD|nr:hypothetical protein [Oculatella sp. LEGE 06141]MBE9178690.1 hypothetical protein [Oculatella sp. LEGE 06141]
MNKSSDAELEQRVHAVYLLLLRREPRQHILRYAASEWGLSTRQTDEYISRARERMTQDIAVDREIARAEHVAIRRDLYNKAYKNEKWGAAFQIAQDEAKLLGLYFDLEDHLKAVMTAGYDVIDPTIEDEEPIAEAEGEDQASAYSEAA